MLFWSFEAASFLSKFIYAFLVYKTQDKHPSHVNFGDLISCIIYQVPRFLIFSISYKIISLGFD
jgi:hypothetical protein